MNSDSRKRVFQTICSEHSPVEVSAILHDMLTGDNDLPLSLRAHFSSISKVLASNLCQPVVAATSEPGMTRGGILVRGRKRSVLPMLRSWQPRVSCGYIVSAVSASSRSTLTRAATLACRTIAVGNLLEIQSPSQFSDNYYGVVFKVYSPCAFPSSAADNLFSSFYCAGCFGQNRVKTDRHRLILFLVQVKLLAIAATLLECIGAGAQKKFCAFMASKIRRV